MSLVTVATFSNSFNLYVIKGRLETEGIPCFVKDEYAITVNPLYGSALGGIKLQVREEDAPEAMRILNEIGYRHPQPVEEETHTGKRPMHPLLKFLIYFVLFIVMLGVIYILHNPLSYLEPQQDVTFPLFPEGRRQ